MGRRGFMDLSDVTQQDSRESLGQRAPKDSKAWDFFIALRLICVVRGWV